MIEFIIPLNLPLRTVAATSVLASPPESLRLEIDQFKRRRSKKSLANHGSPTPREQESHSDVARTRELEQLRSHRNLFRNAVEELQNASRRYEQRLASMVHELQLATIELAHAISAKLVFEEVDANRFPIANLVHEVIARLDTSATAIVRLHPDDLALIEVQPTIGGNDDECPVQFVADPTLARGDCKAKAGEISVVYEIQRQIDDIRRQLLSTVNGHAEN